MPSFLHTVLIIGCGSIGERHLRCFQKTQRARVLACDTNTALLDRINQSYAAPTFTQVNQALAAGCDAVVICTPAHLHVPLALQALQAGKHVLIEKPLSQSLNAIPALIALRDTTRRQVGVAYVYHHHKYLCAARDFLRQGSLGPVKHVAVQSGQNFPRVRPAHAQPYAQTYYRDRATGGGAIQDALTHIANWVESVVGPTDSVMCDCAHQVLPGVTVEDTVTISARNGDALVSYSLNQFQAPNETTVQFNTAKGSVKIELHHQRWGVYKETDSGWTWHETPRAEWDTAFLAQANTFLDQIEGGVIRLCSIETALHTLRFNLAALASADSGKRIRCDSLDA